MPPLPIENLGRCVVWRYPTNQSSPPLRTGLLRSGDLAEALVLELKICARTQGSGILREACIGNDIESVSSIHLILFSNGCWPEGYCGFAFARL